MSSSQGKVKQANLLPPQSTSMHSAHNQYKTNASKMRMNSSKSSIDGNKVHNQSIKNSLSNSRGSVPPRHLGNNQQPSQKDQQHLHHQNEKVNSRIIDDFNTDELDMVFDQNDSNIMGSHIHYQNNNSNNNHHLESAFNLSGNNSQISSQPHSVRPLQNCQAQGGQGEQSQNQSQIMQHNTSGFGVFPDEPSAILDRQSSQCETGSRDMANYAAIPSASQGHQQQSNLIHQQRSLSNNPVQIVQQTSTGGAIQQNNAARLNEAQTNNGWSQPNLQSEVCSLQRVVNQLCHELGGIASQQPQIQVLLQAAIKHSGSLQESLAQEQIERKEWRMSFKEKVRVKLDKFKDVKKLELRKAEEHKFTQQINEFELHERVSTLEQEYRRQAEEINEQANANEILKYEKMRLIQQHSKRLVQIENALSKIQIQKRKEPVQKLKSNEIIKENSKKDSGKQLNDSNAQSKVCKTAESPLNVSAQQSKDNHSVGSQISSLKHLVKEFKDLSDKQRQEQKEIHDFQVPDDLQKQPCDKQPSLSDIDFNPQQQKLMNNFFSSTRNDEELINQKDVDFSRQQSLKSSTGDANKAVIIPDDESKNNVDEDRETVVGDLAQQLNDTSFFAGNNANDIQLPDNLNFFSKGDETEFEFHPEEAKDCATGPSRDQIRQIEDDMACFVDEDLFLNGSSGFQKEERKQNQTDNLDSDDKEVEDLFKDSESDSQDPQLESLKRQLDTKVKHKKQKDLDVNIDDLMQASVATDLRHNDHQKNGFQNQEEADSKKDDLLNLSEVPILEFKPPGFEQQKHELSNKEHDANLSLALEDLSAIVSENPADKSNENVPMQVDQTASEDDQNLADLHRNLMPNFIVNIGEKQIKMPRLDLERVAGLFESEPFNGNLKLKTGESLETDTILDTHKDLLMKGGQTETSGGSFLNETGSKQVQSQQESLKSKQKSESVIDYLNKCDDAISAIIDEAQFDDQIVQVPNAATTNPVKCVPKTAAAARDTNEFCNVEMNMLDSLREELLKEEELRDNQPQNSDGMAFENRSQTQQEPPKSPTVISMPFELRDSFKSKLTDSNQMKSSVVTYAANEKRCLSQVGQKNRIGSNSVEGRTYNLQEQSAQTQPRLIKKNELTMSQKEFDKKSQMMRLSELDSASGGNLNHLNHKHEKDEVTRTQKFGKIPAARKISAEDGTLQPRNRAPSENQALERQNQNRQQTVTDDSEKDKMLSPHTLLTNGTDSIVGSLQQKSLLGDKSRLSAPITIPAKSNGAIIRESAYTTEVVNEVEDEESKILSVNNSGSKLLGADEASEQSIHMLAYNSAYPHTTKNIRQLKNEDHKNSQKNIKQPGVNRRTKVSINRVQNHAEMSSLIKNQQKSSSSIQRLKIVKKVSVNSAAANPNENKSVQQKKRDVLSSNSIERPSVGSNSSMSMIEQSRGASSNANASLLNRDYASVGGGQKAAKESSNQRLSINTRKSKPITVSFKNIVKAKIQKRKGSNVSVQNNEQQSDKNREDSEKRSSIVNLQRVACDQVAQGAANIRTGKISVATKGSSGTADGKTLNITVMRNNNTNQSVVSNSQTKMSDDGSKVVKQQVIKFNNHNSSVEEGRDGSIIFVGNRKNTVERVKAKRDSSATVAIEADDKRASSKSKTKMLIAAHQIKQRKLSIGSASAATSLLQQNLHDSGTVNRGIKIDPTNGSRAQTENSKVTSPASPKRLSSKSLGVKVQNQGTHQNHAYKPQQQTKQTVKKSNIISLKRRDTQAAVTENSQNLTNSKAFSNVINQAGIRNASVGTDGNQSSKRSQITADAPNLKIKRMTKSKNSRAKSSRPNTILKADSSQNQFNIVNQTAFVGPSDSAQFAHDSFLRDHQTNQSSILPGDMSLLSKIGGDPKGQLHMKPGLSNYGGTTTAINQSGSSSILINQQNSQSNITAPLAAQFYSETVGAKSAGGKRIGLSRGSVYTNSSEHQASIVNQSMAVAGSSNFVPNAKDLQASSGTMQISQKAMKIISTQKTKICGAQRQVQMEWKTSAIQQASNSNIQVSKHRNSAADAYKK